MEKFELINLEWNDYNGFLLSVIGIEAGDFNSALFGLTFSSNFFYIDILFMSFMIFDTTEDD